VGASAQEAAPDTEGGVYSVVDFGAAGDGVADNTNAFQKALDTAGMAGGGVVSVPAGNYLFRGHLNLPPRVALEGIWKAPVRGELGGGENPLPAGGSVLLVTEGKGSADGPPFIKLNTSSTIRGLTFFYPEQIQANPPHAYPWTVQGEGDNPSIIHVTMINPYQAVDFGTKFCGRHYVDGLYAQALYRGIYIDQCYDVGRVQNIHFWPFWTVATKGDLFDFTYENGIAFQIARTDGEMGLNLFQIFYSIGFQFIDAGNGGGSGMYTNCYSDVTPVAVQIDATHQHAPVSFVNGSFMSQAIVRTDKQAVASFTGCGFWSVRDARSHAVLGGKAIATFTGCTFYDWDRDRKGFPAIDSDCESLVVTGSQFFMDQGRKDLKKQMLKIGENTRSAVIVGNRMEGGVNIENNAKNDADIQIGLNAGL
jgi:hypothetical protein